MSVMKALGRLKLLFVIGFVSYGIISALLSMLYFMSEFPFILHGGAETFFVFNTVVYALVGDNMYSETAFEEYLGIIVGFIGTAVVWALFAIFIHGIISWLDEDKHVFERFKRKL